MEENNYYPFGLKHKGYNDLPMSSLGNDVGQKWKYNGVELDETTGLYEMDFRQYDPAIGRFTAIDPVTHFSMSTYTAFDNNPVYWADPSGANSVQDLIDDVWEKTKDDGLVHHYNNEGEETGTSDPNESENDDCCGDTLKGVGKGIANGVVDTFGFGWERSVNEVVRFLSDDESFVLLPRFEINEGEEGGYMVGIILFALADPSPSGEVQVIRVLIQGGKATKIIKGVNSMLPHAVERAVERGIFHTVDEASAAIKNLTKQVGKNELPVGTIVDPTKTDRILVPIGNNGMAVYQVGSNGTAKLKTVLNAK